MKKIFIYIFLALLLSTNAFSKNYKCKILGEDETVNLVRTGGLYYLRFNDGAQWPVQIYQESKELIVMGEISNEEGEFEQEIEDRVIIILFSKIHNTAKAMFYNNQGVEDEEPTLLDCN